MRCRGGSSPVSADASSSWRDGTSGKSALLADAAEQAAEFNVLRGLGWSRRSSWPSPPSTSCCGRCWTAWSGCPARRPTRLRGAFGLVDTEVNRFLVEVGVLTLLSELAAEQPVLCLVDEAQRLDSASADALVFMGRRLQAEPIVVLLAARDDEVRQFDAPGLPSLGWAGWIPRRPGGCWTPSSARWPRRSVIG
jgi:hypothetical protein